jgi:predicted AAA+ superfamily ATPase
MVRRPFWINAIEQAWKKRSLIWLAGVRRVGKTTLAKMLTDTVYLNCDLPSVVRKLDDPELFYQNISHGKIIIFDEIHRLSDPSRVLKIGADEFPGLKILATGSSTLEATAKFRDSLTGRKISLHLTPVTWDESGEQFGITDLDHRLLFGGLPESLLSKKLNTEFFSEWMDSFYARDIQELFHLRNRTGFLKLLHLLFRSSGNLVDYTQLSKMSGLSRPTVMTYFEALGISQAIHMVSPFHGGGRRELVRQSKCYAYDTGFISFIKGWGEIREDDRGILWEHLVLDMFKAYMPGKKIFYWRDKSSREIDFVVKGKNDQIDIFECKINPDAFSLQSLNVFRNIYPKGRNFCICPFIKEKYSSRRNKYTIEFIGSINQVNS